MPFMTYQEQDGYKEKATDTWQWNLLHDRPEDEVDVFQFFYDINVSLESTQNAFVQKMKQGQQVIGFQVIDPQRVSMRRAKDGSKIFDVYVGPGGSTSDQYVRDLTADDILHIRGFTMHPGDIAGTSLLDTNEDAIGNAIAMEKFEGDFFRNNALPPFFFTGAKNKQHAKDLMDLHNAEHRGVGNQWRTAALWGDTDVKHIPISLKDAMFVESKNMSIEDICRIWRWPRMLMEIGEVREPTIDYNIADMHMMKMYVLPRLRRIETAFNADPDVYFGTPYFGEFLTAAMERADTHTRYDAYRLARQGGWISPNELRAAENLPPKDGGDDIQLTPVGGAPNPAKQVSPDTPDTRPVNNGNTPTEEAQLVLTGYDPEQGGTNGSLSTHH
jgi:HK97 family phage portal protein